MSTRAGRGAADDGWTIIVPVKALDRAKSRLARALSAPGRRALVLAMATDVLRACVGSPAVSRVRVVTSDAEVTALAHRLGLEVVPEPEPGADEPGTDPLNTDPLNTALLAALDGVSGPVGVVAADLPELDSDTLERILAAAARHPHSMVPDHRGLGTTMAFWTGPARARIPRFGADSAARHVSEGGAVPLRNADTSGVAERDVDTPEDLAELSGRSVGGATATTLRARTDAPAAHSPGVSVTMVP